MAARANKPVSVTLGPLAGQAEARVRSGAYASMSEVVRAGLRALGREEVLMDALLRARVEAAMADSRPDVSAAHVSTSLRSRHEARMKRDA